MKADIVTRSNQMISRCKQIRIWRRWRSVDTGFTLVEVLVVMGLIAILGSLLFGNFLKSQRRGFDAQRQGDLKTIQNAFEQYYVANDGVYPVNDTEGGSEFPGGNLPLDPRDKNQATGDAYEYIIEYGVGDGYCACARLEEVDGNASDVPSGYECQFGDGPWQCVENVQ
ncbi:MAG: type II secretion system protein [Candidatus Chisholmbacteria bacterium]|nr:type II secretion system protein [Candidatus Chisholmbacteria bacterium]